MAQQTIALGSAPNDGTGDDLRSGGSKINANFTELYAAIATLYNIDILTVSTAGGTVTLNFASDEQRIFVGSASFAAPKTIALSNATNAKRFEFIFTITDAAAILTFPSAFIMNDIRWSTGSQEWEPNDIGTYKGSALFDGTNWILDISQTPYL